MRSLTFTLTGARALDNSVAPAIALELAITGDPVSSAMINCQIAFEPAARVYAADERERLGELFGTGAPPRSLVWTQTSIVAPAFDSETHVEIIVPCPFDFSEAVAKYVGGVREGVLPIVVQLSGSVFYDEAGRLRISPIPRDRETRYRIPLAVWAAAIDRHYPDRMPIALARGTVDRLHRYRRTHGLATLEQAIDALLSKI
jgi:hypothetical protein